MGLVANCPKSGLEFEDAAEATREASRCISPSSGAGVGYGAPPLVHGPPWLGRAHPWLGVIRTRWTIHEVSW